MKNTSIILVFVVATVVKVLLIPAYKSTDFEVHRNWLAITHSVPLSRWYYEDTSQWTLDYPPFFAWFEWGLSQVAAIVDPEIVRVDNLNYDLATCLLFQRFSVMVADLILLYAVIEYCKYLRGIDKEHEWCSLSVSILVLMNCGLFIVDHIHFQYNGFLFGFLLLSVTRMLQDRYMEAAFIFAALLNFKHIFVYVAPAYFLYLLRKHCFTASSGSVHGVHISRFLPVPFIQLGILVAAIFAASLGPFIYQGQLRQVLSRLFPFKRGLCHAYWAPNFWALYNLLDKLLTSLGTRFGLVSSSGPGLTSGLIGEQYHQALPSISPLAAMAITALTMMPCLVKLWLRPTPRDFLKALILCAYSSFLFGWHVHEKAIMMVTLPMCFLVVQDHRYFNTFLLISTSGHISLFPLLFQPAETPIKVCLFSAYSMMTFVLFKNRSQKSGSTHGFILSPFQSLYVVVLLLVQVYCIFLHGVQGFLKHYEFLPLLMTSVSCAVGVVWSWLICYHDFLTDEGAKQRIE
ncbi:hypothetical protein EMCRGX_G034014 [Ephydatia muelleri]